MIQTKQFENNSNNHFLRKKRYLVNVYNNIIQGLLIKYTFSFTMPYLAILKWQIPQGKGYQVLSGNTSKLFEYLIVKLCYSFCTFYVRTFKAFNRMGTRYSGLLMRDKKGITTEFQVILYIFHNLRCDLLKSNRLF